MIIDAHAHLFSDNFISQTFWDYYVKISAALTGKPAERIEKRIPEFQDDTGELLLKDMDDAGVDQSWIMAIDYGLSKIGECKYPVEELNRRYAEIARNSKNRLVAFYGIDPRRTNGDKLLVTAVKEWGMRGLKLLPPNGFYPNNKDCYKLYSKASELGIPVLIHTGPELTPGYSKYCRPIYSDDVANDFPEMPVILAHSGFCWWEEALHIAATKPNVYLDISGWQAKILHHPIEELYMPLRRMIDTIGPSRILFGSDWPGYRLFKGGEATWVKTFTEPPEEVKQAGITFSKDEIDAIMGGNAARLIPVK